MEEANGDAITSAKSKGSAIQWPLVFRWVNGDEAPVDYPRLLGF